MAQRRAALVVVLLLSLAPGSGSGPSVRAQPVSALHECACPGLRINEFLPKPHDIDWNGDGRLDFGDQWVELCNAAGTPCNLQGWALRSCENSYTFTKPISLGPYDYAVFYRSETGLSLNLYTCALGLVHPDAAPYAPSYSYYYTSPDVSYSLCQSGLTWDCVYPPSPGWANGFARPVYLPLATAG